MKRVFSIICVILSVFAIVLSGCDPSWEYIPLEYLEEAESIELVYYNNDSIKKAESDEDCLPYDFTKAEIKEQLKSDFYEDFLTELGMIQFWPRTEKPVWGLNSAKGISLKVNFNNGEFYLLCANKETDYYSFAAQFDAEGQLIYLYRNMSTCNPYIRMINKYFETQIEE